MEIKHHVIEIVKWRIPYCRSAELKSILQREDAAEKIWDSIRNTGLHLDLLPRQISLYQLNIYQKASIKILFGSIHNAVISLIVSVNNRNEIEDELTDDIAIGIAKNLVLHRVICSLEV